MDEHVEHSCRSWLGDFTQQFSWRSLFAQAIEFLNNYFFTKKYKDNWTMPVR